AGEFEDLFGNLFSSIFGGAFGGGSARGRAGVQRGHDLRVRYAMTLEEAFEGKDIELKIKRHEPCEDCKATGCKAGTHPSTCLQCGGQGQVRVSQGFFSMISTCPACSGKGKVISNPCETCNGTGLAERKAGISVTVPRGVADGTQLRLTGEGDSGPKGTARGDLYIVIQIKEHEFFVRRDDDLYCEVPISFAQAALGAEIAVPTIDSTTKLRIPAGSQTHQVIRLRNQGMSRSSSRPDHRGDQYVQVIVFTPKELTDRQKELLREFAESEGEDLREDKRSLFSKFRDRMEEVKKDWLG
ncbi:molecular chaperone DnaJ, partial [bacterium]|nr:molecular chaperone DnaJ [bacterium]